MDIEWAKDGVTGELFIVQARPETVQSAKRRAAPLGISRVKGRSSSLASASVRRRGHRACLHHRKSQRIRPLPDGAILVTHTTDPDWVPIMRRAAAIITDRGGRTSHAAIVSRELGLPAVVGTGDATQVLHDEQDVTVSCAEGEEGFIYEGTAGFRCRRIDLAHPRNAHAV